MGFQTSVNLELPIAVEGDFASSNPRSAVVAPIAGFQAGTAGVVIGNFAWIQSGGQLVLNTGATKPDGYIHRDQEGLNTTYLSDAGVTIPHGFPVTIMRTGDYFDKVTVSAATRGQKAFAKLSDGTMRPAAAGSTIAGFAGTASFATSVMTVTVVGSGVIGLGDLVTSAGVAAGTYVVSFGTGTGGTGTYNLSTAPGTISAQAVTTTGYIETDFTIDQAGSVGDLVAMTF